MKKLFVASFACLGLLADFNGTAHATSLVANGSFEDGAYSGSDSFMTLNAGSTAIDDWTVESGSIDWINGYWAAKDGQRSIDLAGEYKHGLISTTINTVKGQGYRVQFDIAGNPDRDYEKTMLGLAAVPVEEGQEPASPVYFNFVQTGNTHTNMGWVTRYFDFVATSAETTLYFGDITGQLIDGVLDPGINLDEAYGAALDNVTVEAVPEPSTFALLGAGLVAAGMLRRKTRRNA